MNAELTDLASRAVRGSVVHANDEFFAERENLIKPETPVHQPHTYSRTQHMYREFAEVLESHADHTVVLDVYGAREDPVPGVTGPILDVVECTCR